MKTLCRFWLFIVLLTGWFSAPVDAQIATTISDTRAAQHVGQKVTVEGVVAVFTACQTGNSDASDLKIKWYTLWVTAAGFLLTVGTLWFNFHQLRQQREKDFQLEFWKSRLELYKDACQTASTLATSEKGSDEYKKAFAHFRQLFWGTLCIVESQEVETAMIKFNDGLTNDKGQLEDLSYELAHTCRDSLRKAFNLTDTDLGFIPEQRKRGTSGAPTPSD